MSSWWPWRPPRVIRPLRGVAIYAVGRAVPPPSRLSSRYAQGPPTLVMDVYAASLVIWFGSAVHRRAATASEI